MTEEEWQDEVNAREASISEADWRRIVGRGH